VRVVLGFLILANVGVWMWATWYKPPVPHAEPHAPRADVAANKMRLVSEPGAKLVTRPKSAAAGNDTTAAQSRCFRLGPFPSPEKVQAAGALLARWGLSYERVTEFETLGTAYRLYLPAFATKEAAERKRQELTRLGFNDHALIEHEFGMQNAVSLGIFAIEQNAQVRRQQLAAKGIDAAVQLVPNVHANYWLALSGTADDARLGEVALARFAERDWGAPGVALKATPCSAGPRETTAREK